MQCKSFVSKTISRPSKHHNSSIGLLEWMKLGFLGSMTIVLLMMFLFLTSTTSTAGHALNKALRGFDTTMQQYSYTKYEIAGADDVLLQQSVNIPTTNLTYQNNIVAVSDTSNFAFKK